MENKQSLSDKAKTFLTKGNFAMYSTAGFTGGAVMLVAVTAHIIGRIKVL